MLFVDSMDAGLGLRLSAQRQVDSHLVAVEVGVERATGQGWRMAHTLNQLGLNAWMPRRWAWLRLRSTGCSRIWTSSGR